MLQTTLPPDFDILYTLILDMLNDGMMHQLTGIWRPSDQVEEMTDLRQLEQWPNKDQSSFH